MKIGTLDINNLYVGGSQASAAYLGSTQVYPSQPTGQPNDEIWYTSTNNQVVTPYNTSGFGANIVSNTYTSGKGVIKFDAAIDAVPVSAFSECMQLYSISLPNTIESLGNSSFYNCSGLTEVTVYNGITIIGARCFWNCSGMTSFDIPNTVTTIDARAFGRCQGLSSIIIPSSVTTIGETAFGVANLSSITIPDTVTLLGEQSFLDCPNLSSITFGTGITVLKSYVVGRCRNLSTINYNGTMAQWYSLTKESNWKINVPATVVHCTDGDVAL